MITFSLTTFIKICLLDTGGRISEIQRRLNSAGGYDYYKTLYSAIRFRSDGDMESAENILEVPTSESERKYNRLAYDAFVRRFGSSRSISSITQRTPLDFPEAGLTISIDPLFETEKAGVRQVYSVWSTQKPQLNQKYGAVACHLMRRAFKTGPLANSDFYFADLTNNKIYSERQINNNTNLILTADVNSIGTLIRQL